MKEMDEKYPVYGFAAHKGYGTKTHCNAIVEYGPCPIHRRSFLEKILAAHPESAAFSGKAAKSPQSAGAAATEAEEPALAEFPSGRETGRYGEEEAVRFLEKKGVKILARNFRDRDGEIDIIAEEDGVLVFVEVKYRRSSRYGEPEEAVTADKQRRICRTALYYLHQTGRGTQIPVRFDVISVTDKSIRHIRDAFSFVR